MTPVPDTRAYRIAVITGDGIGKEVVPEGAARPCSTP